MKNNQEGGGGKGRYQSTRRQMGQPEGTLNLSLNAVSSGKKTEAPGGISTLLSSEGHSFQRTKKYKLNNKVHGCVVLSNKAGVFGQSFARVYLANARENTFVRRLVNLSGIL